MSLSKAEILELKARYSDRAWAHALRLRHERGDVLSSYQVRCYRAALGLGDVR